MISNNVYHLFQRCPCKMMSKTSEAGIHMYMMKAHELMGVWGCQGGEEFLSDVWSPVHKYSKGITGITWPFMPLSCIQFLFVCGCRTRGQKPILSAMSFPCQNMFHHFRVACPHLLLIKKKRIWWGGRDQATSLFLNTALAWMVWSGGGGAAPTKKHLFVNYKLLSCLWTSTISNSIKRHFTTPLSKPLRCKMT